MKNNELQDTLTFETFTSDEVPKRAIKFEQSKQTTQAHQKSVTGNTKIGQFNGPQIKLKREPIMSVGNKGQNYKRPNRDQFRKKTNEQRNTKFRQEQKQCTRCGRIFREVYLKNRMAMGKTVKTKPFCQIGPFATSPQGYRRKLKFSGRV